MGYKNMSVSQFDLVIFDCDGVLVDSEPIVNRVFAEVLTEFGFPITAAELMQRFTGKSLQTCLDLIEQSFGKSVPENFVAHCREREIAALEQELQPITGILETLEYLPLPRCVASNSSHRHIQLVLTLTELLPQFAGKIYSAYDVDRPKPFPDVYLYAAQQMGIPPERCLVIEDTVTGVQAGCAAGMTVFGYAERSDRVALAAAGATFVFDQMQNLPEAIVLKWS